MPALLRDFFIFYTSRFDLARRPVQLAGAGSGARGAAVAGTSAASDVSPRGSQTLQSLDDAISAVEEAVRGGGEVDVSEEEEEEEEEEEAAGVEGLMGAIVEQGVEGWEGGEERSRPRAGGRQQADAGTDAELTELLQLLRDTTPRAVGGGGGTGGGGGGGGGGVGGGRGGSVWIEDPLKEGNNVARGVSGDG